MSSSRDPVDPSCTSKPHAPPPTAAPKATSQSAVSHSATPARNPPPETESTQHRRKGRVARLPCHIRTIVNTMLDDGHPYDAIIKKVAEAGHELNGDSLCRWYSGGYQDWLKHQSLLEEADAQIDFASEVVFQSCGHLIGEASVRIALVRLYSLLLDFDPTVLKELISANPGAYARLLSALCKLTDGAIKLERHRREERVK